MPGEYEMKFDGLRLFLAYMFAHPGKKLLFMGSEFGQFIEWNYKQGLDWLLLDYDMHKKMLGFSKTLNNLYKETPALWQIDYSWDGFQWINANDGDRSIFSFVRYAKNKRKSLLFVCNFTPMERPEYRVGVPKRGNYTLLLDNGHGAYAPSECPVFRAVKKECDGQPFSISLPLSAYGTAILRFS